MTEAPGQRAPAVATPNAPTPNAPLTDGPLTDMPLIDGPGADGPGADLPPVGMQAPDTLPPAARRALQEAEERRAKVAALALPPELGGRDGPDPVRYGDWEKKGIAIDF